MVTRSPRDFSRLPRLEAVSPFPREEATPPVTKTCLVGPVEYVAAANSDSRGQSRYGGGTVENPTPLHGVPAYQRPPRVAKTAAPRPAFGVTDRAADRRRRRPRRTVRSGRPPARPGPGSRPPGRR